MCGLKDRKTKGLGFGVEILGGLACHSIYGTIYISKLLTYSNLERVLL